MKQVLVKGHAGKHLLENSLYVLLGPDRERISICGTTKRQLVRATHHELYLIRTAESQYQEYAQYFYCQTEEGHLRWHEQGQNWVAKTPKPYISRILAPVFESKLSSHGGFLHLVGLNKRKTGQTAITDSLAQHVVRMKMGHFTLQPYSGQHQRSTEEKSSYRQNYR